jgi:hypothetical protein
VDDADLEGVARSLGDRLLHDPPCGLLVVGVDVRGEQPVHRHPGGLVEPEDGRAALVPVDEPAAQVDLPDADRAGLQRHAQPPLRPADVGVGRGQLQLGHDRGGQLAQQLGLVVGPRPRFGVVEGQHPDDLARVGDQRGAEVGAHLPGGDGGQTGDPLVGGGVADRQGRTAAHHHGRERTGEQRRAADDARRQAMAADDGVLVGEEGDLGVAGAHEPGGQTGEPVVGRVPGDLGEQPAGRGRAHRIGQRVGVLGGRGRRHATPPSDHTAQRTGRSAAGSCCHAAARGRNDRCSPARVSAATPVQAARRWNR